jgi:hypothetical protein
MSVPPLLLDLLIEPAGKRRVHLWLPLLLLWPLALVFGGLALAASAVADAVLLAMGRPDHHYTALLAKGFALLAETRGTVISFSNERTTVHMTVK